MAKNDEQNAMSARPPAYSDGGPLTIPDDAPKTLVEALIRTAGRYPEKGITYVRADRSTSFQSYPALLARARCLLAGLRRAGLEPGARAVLQFDNLEDHLATFWACVLGGITPVNVAVPPSYEVESGVTGKIYNTWALLERPPVIAGGHLATPIQGLHKLYAMDGLRVLTVEELAGEEPAPIHECKPEDLLFFQLSSGSTGVPKVIQEAHRGIIRHAYAAQVFCGYSPDDVWLNWLPLDHVVPTLTCHLKDVVLGSAQVMISPAAVLGDPLLWLDLIERYRATHTWAPNFGFKLVADSLPAPDGRSWDLSSMKFLMNAGEQVTLPVVSDFLRLTAPFGIREQAMQPAFGMAEVCTCMTYANDFTCEAGVNRVLKSTLGGPLEITEARDNSSIPFVDLGPPVPGVEIRITDSSNQVVPECTIGRLQIRGGVVTPGYLRNDNANKEAFVGDDWFNSGDLGFMYRGRLTLTGREKEMIIVRGANFYCYEIEDVVNAIPGVEPTFVAAVAVDDPRAGTEGLGIFFVAREHLDPLDLVSVIRSRVAANLGLSPAYVISLPRGKFPKTTSGKIQRTQLKKDLIAGIYKEESRAPEADGGDEPTTELEQKIAAIWREVLNLPRVGVRQSFFELGGHSLVATQIISRLRSTLAVEVSLRDLFEGPTVAELAKTMEKLQKKVTAAIPRLPRTDGAGTFPLSFGQERLFFLDRWEPGTAAYNEAFAFRIEGPLGPELLARSAGELVRRHEIFRTTFALRDGVPVQIVAPAGPEGGLFACPVIELEGPPEFREAEALRRAVAEARAPFDLGRGPLFRLTLYKLSAEEHLLLLTMHHIVTDGWSFGLFMRELGIVYEALAAGKPSPLPEMPIQYADFAGWQRTQLGGEALDDKLAYWKKTLSGELAPLGLPTDRPRPAILGTAGAKRSIVLPAELTKQIRALAGKHEVTLFLLLQAAFRIVLHRWSAQDDLLVGSPTAGRGRMETEGLLGFFVNNLVIRTNLAGDPSFAELLGRVREAALGAYAHDDVPFEKLLEAIAPARDTSRTPLFQVFFNLLSFSDYTMERGGLRFTPMDVDRGTSNFDLTLYAIEERDRLLAVINYNTDLFDEATAERMLGHLQAVLEGVVAHPARKISAYPLLGEAERRALEGASTRMIAPAPSYAPFPREAIEQPIHRRFEEQARKHPERIAVAGEEWTYAELNRRANRIARRLLGQTGSGSGNVGICFEHGGAMVAAMLGVLKAGKSYVPLDPTYPTDRLAFMLEDSEARSILASPAMAGNAQALGKGALPVIVAGDDDGPSENLDLPIDPGSLAYLLYTSGSTGKPKGVMQSHRNVLHFMQVYTENLKLGPEDRLTLFSSFAFDAAVMDIYGAILNGAALCPADVKARGLGEIAAFLSSAKITVYHSTPTLYRHLFAAAPQGARFPAVRLVVLGGEEVVRRDLEIFRQRFDPPAVFVNGLGPTESTVTLQAFFDHTTPHGAGAVPVGFPVAGTTIRLLDEAGVPGAIRGEIEIGSEHVALGYYRRPELTHAAFRSEPEGGRRRAYRTGDIGRLRPDGQLEFLGRRDAQVKIRGYRVELGEVEAALGSLPEVAEAVVFVRDDAAGNTSLVGYVVAAAGSAITTAGLREALETRLPAHMIPSAFMVLDAMPLTPTGKIDRLALPAPAASVAPSAGYVAPRHAVEVELVRIWESVLGSAPIGVHDSFFDRGGHSLLALRLFAEIEKNLGKSLPISTLFRAPTVEQMAAILAREGYASAWPSLVPIQPEGVGQPFFCVHAIGANVLNYRLLSRHLGPSVRFYGIQSRGLDGQHAPHDRVEEMAAHYIEEIRTVQPRGPYLLGGGSSGGVIAWEMAQQLRAAGEEVALLALIDTYYRGYERYEPGARGARSAIYRVAWKLDLKMAQLLLGEGQDPAGWLLREAGGWAARSVRKLTKGFSDTLPEDPLPPVVRKVRDANIHAMKTYVPKPYSGRAALFLTLREPVRAFNDRRMVWSELAQGGLELYTIPGNHETVLDEPDVAVLADKLGVCLDRARKER